MNAPLTDHARKRMQQRGITRDVLEALLRFGRRRHDGHGGCIVMMDGRCRERAAREGLKPPLFEKLRDAYAVLDMVGAVITVGHRDHRLPHA